jgi:hypothetical protein
MFFRRLDWFVRARLSLNQASKPEQSQVHDILEFFLRVDDILELGLQHCLFVERINIKIIE